MANVVLYFTTNTDTMIATKALRDSGVAAKMLPTPANAVTSANLCLSIDSGAETAARAALRSSGVALSGAVEDVR